MESITGAVAVCFGTDRGTGPGVGPTRKSTTRVATRRVRHPSVLGIIALLLGVSCNGVDEPVRPEILASEPVTGSGSAGAISTGLIFSLDISSLGAPGCREQGVAIFYRTIIREGDQHHTLVADAGNEPDFAEFAHLLTDGVDDVVAPYTGLANVDCGGTASSESMFFGGRPGTAPDFAGYTIDRVEFQIDSVLIASPGSDPNHDGIHTDYYLAGHVVVWGHR